MTDMDMKNTQKSILSPEHIKGPGYVAPPDANIHCSDQSGSLSDWIDLKFISNTPELTGLLYDLDLIPEQVEKGTKDEHRLYVLTRYFKENK